jgi:hypothetical protein
MILRKGKYTGTSNGKHEIILFGQLALEEAMDLS